MAEQSVTVTIDGYTVMAEFTSTGIRWTLNKPDGSQLLRAGDASGITYGLNKLQKSAIAAGDTELADKLFQLNSGLLSLVLFFIRHFSNCWFSACCNAMIYRTEIPRYYLTIYGTTQNNAWAFRVEFNCCNFNWSL